jgi:hypothetical protein
MSTWRNLGIALAVLGAAFIIGGIAAHAANYVQYVAVLIVFGGIFLVIGAGLVVITFFEKEESLPPPPPS